MATQKLAYAAQTSVTITPGALASASARQSAVIDNTTNLFLDALVSVNITYAAGSVALDQGTFVYAYGWDGGSLYTGTASGSDASYTMQTVTPLKLIGFVPASSAGVFQTGPFSVAAGFGGILPPKWGIVLYNNSGLAFSTSSTTYVGISATIG